MSDPIADLYHDFVVAQARSIQRRIMDLLIERERHHIVAMSIQSRFGVHRDTAKWLAGRLPESVLPDRDAVETIIALERM